MPKAHKLLTQAWIELAALALAGLGFRLVPDDPALPALILKAVAIPLASLFAAAFLILERREAARARPADAACGHGGVGGRSSGKVSS